MREEPVRIEAFERGLLVSKRVPCTSPKHTRIKPVSATIGLPSFDFPLLPEDRVLCKFQGRRLLIQVEASDKLTTAQLKIVVQNNLSDAQQGMPLVNVLTIPLSISQIGS